MRLRGKVGGRGKPKKTTKTRHKPTVQVSGASRLERVVSFIESLPITSGFLAGQNFKVHPFQLEMLKGIYREDGAGERIVRTAVISTPRKQGKTGLTAALALCHLCGPEAERRGQVYSAAADRAQAGIVYNEMKAIVQAVPELDNRIIIRDFHKHLEDYETGSTYQALSADSNTKHGLSASCIIYDELAQAPNRKLYDVLASSTGARAHPIMIVISTQSADPHSIMTELTDYGIQVRDGIIEDPTFFLSLYQAPDDADPWSEATWRACNPAIEAGFRSLQEIKVAALQAQRIPAREASFRLLYLNQRVSEEARFINRADWSACAGDVDIEALRGRPCYCGLDMGSTQDMSALVMFFPEGGAIVPFFWAPEATIDEREDSDRVPYRQWHRAGLIESTRGRAIDKRAIVMRLGEIAAQYDVQGVAFDRWHLDDLQKLLDDEGIQLPLVKWGQGFRDMGPSVDALETAVLNRTVKHGQHPVLNWNVSNAITEQDPTGARKLSKRRSTERIDGLVALTMALGLHARQPKEQPYDFSQGIILK